MLKEDKKEDFVTAANTSVGSNTSISSDRALGSTTPNCWLSFNPNLNIAPLVVTMTLWLRPEAIDCIL
jgi:hypothetical protein